MGDYNIALVLTLNKSIVLLSLTITLSRSAKYNMINNWRQPVEPLIKFSNKLMRIKSNIIEKHSDSFFVEHFLF